MKIKQRKLNARKIGPTYVIAHKEIISVGSVASDAKQFDEIVKLAMDIAADGDRTLHRLNIPLLHKDGTRLLAQSLHLRLR